MDIGTWLKAFLADWSAVTSLVGDRIRPVLKQGERMPAITYELVSSVYADDLGYDTSELQSRLYLRCYADSLTEAAAVATAVKSTGLRGFRGTSHGKWINEIALVDEFDGRDPPSEGQDAWRTPRVMELLITHN